MEYDNLKKKNMTLKNEIQVLKSAIEGLSNKEVSEKCGVSLKTVVNVRAKHRHKFPIGKPKNPPKEKTAMVGCRLPVSIVELIDIDCRNELINRQQVIKHILKNHYKGDK